MRGQSVQNVLCRFFRGQGDLFACDHVLNRALALGNLVLAQQHRIGNCQLVGVAHFLLEFLFLRVELDPDARGAQRLRKGNGRRGILFLLPAAAAIAAVWMYPADGSALSVYAGRLSASVTEYIAPGGLDWTLRLYARFGVPGFAAAGFACGALLFLLGRLLRDSFLYSAPVTAAMGWGCMILLKGVENKPVLQDYVFFFVPYGLCLIVGCMRRESGKRRAKG